MNKLLALKFYVRVIFSGLVLLAGVVLLILQWGNKAKFSLYGSNKEPNTLMLMLCSAVGGVVAWWLIKMLWRGIVGLHRVHCAAKITDCDAGSPAA
ncbi:MAG: hypothetical protein ABSH10_05360 [Phycisphaerae bacterium]|jgi:hypothetical protein